MIDASAGRPDALFEISNGRKRETVALTSEPHSSVATPSLSDSNLQENAPEVLRLLRRALSISRVTPVMLEVRRDMRCSVLVGGQMQRVPISEAPHMQLCICKLRLRFIATLGAELFRTGSPPERAEGLDIHRDCCLDDHGRTRGMRRTPTFPAACCCDDVRDAC